MRKRLPMVKMSSNYYLITLTQIIEPVEPVFSGFMLQNIHTGSVF